MCSPTDKILDVFEIFILHITKFYSNAFIFFVNILFSDNLQSNYAAIGFVKLFCPLEGALYKHSGYRLALIQDGLPQP